MPTRLSVCHFSSIGWYGTTLTRSIAKFTGYQYGGRPLGLTFVKYQSAGDEAMEGAEATGGITQDQIM